MNKQTKGVDSTTASWEDTRGPAFKTFAELFTGHSIPWSSDVARPNSKDRDVFPGAHLESIMPVRVHYPLL